MTSPTTLSASVRPTAPDRADVAIWSAILQGLDVRVIPTTSATGPVENIAVTLVDDDAVNLQ